LPLFVQSWLLLCHRTPHPLTEWPTIAGLASSLCFEPVEHKEHLFGDPFEVLTSAALGQRSFGPCLSSGSSLDTFRHKTVSKALILTPGRTIEGMLILLDTHMHMNSVKSATANASIQQGKKNISFLACLKST